MRGGDGGLSGCDQRIEVTVKNQEKSCGGGGGYCENAEKSRGWGGGLDGWGQGGRVRGIEVNLKMQRRKKEGAGGGWM